MSTTKGISLIDNDTQIKGIVKNAHRLEVRGYIEGEVSTETLIIHQGGRVFGRAKTLQAEVNGAFQGDIAVTNLINIKSSGVVSGEVKYGQLSVEPGGELSARVRNIPPEMAGDLDISVKRGQSIKITTSDLTAFDPDDSAENLTYTVSNEVNGYVALTHSPQTPVKKFTQSDIERGQAIFVHNGSHDRSARFDVIVADDDGATSGGPQTVNVNVM